MDVLTYFYFLVFIVEIFEGARNENFTHCPQNKLRFGRVRYKQRGRIARFLCNTGYTLAGDRYSACVQGKWDNTDSRCVKATCQPVKPPVNGLIFPSYGGAVLNFYCKSNFDLRGSNITYCDGIKWDNPLPTCLASNSTPALQCDFENEDLCGWNHDLNHDFNWKRLNFHTPSASVGTGPSYDHTKGQGGDGYYMYIESSARNQNDTARLISPIFGKSPNNTCFEFYYHMYGVATGELRVFIKTIKEAWNFSKSKAIFEKSGNQGNQWYRGFIEIGPINDDYQIIIEGIRGWSYVSDIAIDDVKIINNCVTEAEPTTEQPTSTDFPLMIESCENRCNTTDEKQNFVLITCDCDDKCFDRNRCCPDYYDFCLFEETTTTTEEVSDVTNTSNTSPTSSTTITTNPPKTEKSKIVYIKADDVGEVPTIATPIEEKKEIDFIEDYENDNIINERILVTHETNENSMKTIVFAVGMVFGVLFAAVAMTFVARRYRLLSCIGMRRINQSGHGDSQSDVRFLTGDEILNFSLPADYDTL